MTTDISQHARGADIHGKYVAFTAMNAVPISKGAVGRAYSIYLAILFKVCSLIL